jgi:hypothetical protein
MRRNGAFFLVATLLTMLGTGLAFGQVALTDAVRVKAQSVTAGPQNYQGLWWAAPAASESGWGINFAHQGNTIFATWFTYDSTGKAMWLVMAAEKTADRVYKGTLYQLTGGPAFDAIPFTPTGSPGGAAGAIVGNGTLTFTDANNATFDYTVNAVSQTKAITREDIDSDLRPACIFGAQFDPATATNYQDLWWAAPAGAEAGWGINLTHQGETIFAAWFTYDRDHTPMWLVVSAQKTAPGTYAGTLLRVSGPPFNTIPFPPVGSPGGASGIAVGTATFTFADGNDASFTYTVQLAGMASPVTQTRMITREIFAAPGTVCRPSPSAPGYASGNLIVSRTVYGGTASTVAVGQVLPGGGGGTALADGSFPNVFKNSAPDSSFGVTSPVFLDQRTASGDLVSTTAVDPGLITTSFASGSELALNLSTDRSAVTFMGYKAAINLLDVSTSNTPGVVDKTNPVSATYQRAVAEVNLVTGSQTVTGVNAFSGSSGRAVILASGSYYMVGNAGNGNGDGFSLSALSDNTGVQLISASNPGAGSTTAVGIALGTFGDASGYQRGFSLAQLPDPAHSGQNYAADKTGKDANFRGLTIFNDTLYTTKGSGSNGVNSVYQVGAAGALANGGIVSNAAITILPGFNTLSEKVAEASATLTATPHPFGLWFADASTLFVADDGDGVRLGANGKVTTFAGLGEYKLVGGVWNRVATFQKGLLDQPTYKQGLPWNIKADGIRNLAGKVNADGSITIYATTSIVNDDAGHDAGADPNQLVSITIDANSTPANTSFTVLQTAPAGERFGGVAIAP